MTEFINKISNETIHFISKKSSNGGMPNIVTIAVFCEFWGIEQYQTVIYKNAMQFEILTIISAIRNGEILFYIHKNMNQ